MVCFKCLWGCAVVLVLVQLAKLAAKNRWLIGLFMVLVSALIFIVSCTVRVSQLFMFVDIGHGKIYYAV